MCVSPRVMRVRRLSVTTIPPRGLYSPGGGAQFFPPSHHSEFVIPSSVGSAWKSHSASLPLHLFFLTEPDLLPFPTAARSPSTVFFPVSSCAPPPHQSLPSLSPSKSPISNRPSLCWANLVKSTRSTYRQIAESRLDICCSTCVILCLCVCVCVLCSVLPLPTAETGNTIWQLLSLHCVLRLNQSRPEFYFLRIWLSKTVLLRSSHSMSICLYYHMIRSMQSHHRVNLCVWLNRLRPPYNALPWSLQAPLYLPVHEKIWVKLAMLNTRHADNKCV